MFELNTKGSEWYDDSTSEFITIPSCSLRLEHSLVTISKWEAKWHKPFLSMRELARKNELTNEMLLDYFNCMSLDGPIPPIVLNNLGNEEIKAINDYIEDPATATWFSNSNSNKGGSREVITSEVLYYYMITLNIPIECEHWHLNRLLTLIRVCNEKNAPPTKRSRQSILKSNAAINAARRKALNTKG